MPIGPSPMGAPYQVGLATWYGQSFAGKKTSNGERFDPGAMTAAHRKLPFGTWVEVRRMETGGGARADQRPRAVGDARKVIDLSHCGQPRCFGFTAQGAARVEIRIVAAPY